LIPVIEIDVQAADRRVLEAAYAAMGGTKRERKGWLPSDPVSKWVRVKSDATGQVTRLDLSGSQLKGIKLYFVMLRI